MHLNQVVNLRWSIIFFIGIIIIIIIKTILLSVKIVKLKLKEILPNEYKVQAYMLIVSRTTTY